MGSESMGFRLAATSGRCGWLVFYCIANANNSQKETCRVFASDGSDDPGVRGEPSSPQGGPMPGTWLCQRESLAMGSVMLRRSTKAINRIETINADN
jgi:hypothetical protein